jgi:hypothetical protein
MKNLFVLVAVLTFFVSGVAISAQIDEVNYKGWKCLRMKNADTEVYIAPEIGGRIIQYTYQGHPFLWVNKPLEGKVYPIEENNKLENWKSYGGDKVWPAPQGWDGPSQWPGPGDEIFDSPYKAEIIKKSGDYVKIKLTSLDKGGYSGVQFIREVTLFDNSSRVYFKTTMKNVSKKETNWGIWAITQTDFSGNYPKWNDQAYIAIPMNPKSIWPEKFKVMFGLAESWNWQPDYENMLLKVKYMDIVGKIGIDSYDGWAALVDGKSGYSYVQRWETFPGAPYPDKSTFYAWVGGKGEFIHKHVLHLLTDNPENPDSRFIEMEILGPQAKLKPGESISLLSSWEAVKGDLGAVKDLKKGYIASPKTE